jgi:16S rRNA (cytidine1402-2'-O)-methyltransferase
VTGGTPTLHLVATPIGNLGDLAPRAVEVLGSVALVCCEDTRRTGRLLQHAGIRATRLAVCNEHTELSRIDDVLETLLAGDDVALVTDAGTPGISDPGERLVRATLDAGFRVSAVPGPVAAVTALVISGLPTSRYVFEGFLPRSGKERSSRLADIAADPRTVVIYEAPHRIQRTVHDLTAACGADRQVAIARELTKLYETVTRGSLGSIDIGDPRGEYVIVLAGHTTSSEPPDDDTIRAALKSHLDAGVTRRDAAAAVAGELGVPKRTAYALATAMRGAGTLTATSSETSERATHTEGSR